MASTPILPMGCRFSPSDADLISFYLRPMIASEPLPEPAARFLHTADAYAADPSSLASGLLPAVLLAPRTGAERRCWYFFGPAKALSGHDKRRSRAVAGGKGTWHAEKGRVAVLDGEGRGGVVGYKQSFRYKPSDADGSVEAVWLMVEFRVAHDQGDDEKGETVPVLCKVYQSPRKPRSASISTSPAYKRERKRKARDDSAPATTVKRRLLVPPAAPILPSAVEPQPDLNNCSDGVSVDQLLDDLMSVLTPDQVLGDFLMPVPESEVNCSFSMGNHNSDQILLGDLLMPVVSESEVNYSSSMSDHSGSMVRNYETVLHGGSVTPLLDNSDQFDLSMPIIEPLPTDLQTQTAMLNYFSFLPCAPYAGICDSWTGGDTTDDEAASVSWYGSAPSSPAIPTEWMMQSPFATPYLF
ncbi:protein ATAF2-like [Triticum dicoccoides]|uniref:protein ATAF2-like n=1 Tax=Triticum dicoccoides TaxID=85692 RepID=UPI0018913D4F|nr:protein ATAF2-like [Triticum dicoccoides]